MEDHSSNRHQRLDGNCNHARHNELCGIKERYCVQANHNKSFQLFKLIVCFHKASPQLRQLGACIILWHERNNHFRAVVIWAWLFLVNIIEGITNQMAIMPLYKTKTSSFTVGGFKLQFSLKLIYETNSLKIVKNFSCLSNLLSQESY